MNDVSLNLRNCNLPGDVEALTRLTAALRAETQPQARGSALPFAPNNGAAQAGWLAEANGRAAAYAWFRQQTPGRGLIELGVLPAYRRAGLGSRLLARAAAHAREMEIGQLLVAVPKGCRAGEAFLDHHAFNAFGSILELVAAAGTAIPEVDFGPGHHLRTYRVLGHMPTLAVLLVRAFKDRPGRPESESGAVTAERVQSELDHLGGRMPPDGIFILLNASGKGVGIVRAWDGNRIEAPGVVPEERANNLHIPLLHTAMHYLRQQGAGEIVLDSVDVDSWLDDYLAAGFRVTARQTRWIKDLET